MKQKIGYIVATFALACTMLGITASAEASQPVQTGAAQSVQHRGLDWEKGLAKDTYNTYSIRACWVAIDDSTGPPKREGHACLKLWYKKQEDGTGMNAKTRRVGMWTQNRDGSLSDNCGAFFNNPGTKSSAIDAWFVNQKIWGTFFPELNDGNGCAKQFDTDVGSPGTLEVIWEFTPDIDGGFDGGERHISITVAPNGSWDCTVPGGVQANCTKQGPL